MNKGHMNNLSMNNLSYYELNNINKFEKWYEYYNKNLRDMYTIFIKNLKSNNLKYKKVDNNTFRHFCIFVYNNSSKLLN